MTDQDIIKAIAELDGWSKQMVEDGFKFGNPVEKQIIERWVSPTGYYTHRCPDYLSSRDAIVPVIEKHVRGGNYHDPQTVIAFNAVLGEPCEWQDFACATPRQLCEALLRATGKWTE